MRRFSGYGPSLVVLITAAVVLFAGPAAVRQLTYEQTRTRIIQASERLSHEGNVLEQINQASRDIATMVEPSVVHVSAQYIERDALGRRQLGLSTGSGWVYDDGGHIVTNHHVIQNAQRIEVQLHNGELREATLVGSDPTTDIAVIEISPERLHPATLADLSEVVDQGDMVFAFGSPFDFRFSMSSGVVSGKGRSVGVIRFDNHQIGYENFIQVDAAINPGNSGGPLTDYRGHVIGMNTAIATGRSRNQPSLDEGQFGGIGLAIPIDMIIPAVCQIIERGYVEKSYIGVNVEEIDSEFAQRVRFIGRGVVMRDVHISGPADRAGVRQFDVVTAVNDRAIATSQQLRSMISSMLPGEVARLSIWRFDENSRAGEAMQIDVPLERLDSLRAQGRIDRQQQSRDAIVPLGIERMATATPDAARALDLKFFRGVLLEKTTPESGLQPGSIIIEVRGEPVRDVDELISELAKADFGRGEVQITVADPNGNVVPAVLSLQAQP